MRFRLSFLPWLILSVLLGTLAYSWASGGLMHVLLDPQISAAERVARLQESFQNAGWYAPLLYVGFVIAEVTVAPIPGLMLYAPGGLLFGPWLGGALALIGNILGAGLSCSLARSLGRPFMARMTGNEPFEKLQAQLNQHGFRAIVLLRLNPLTSSDLLSYAAGLTRISILQVMLATGVGMAPLCFAQSWLSDGIFNRWPGLIWPLLVVGLGYLVVVAVVLARLLWSASRKPAAAPSPSLPASSNTSMG